MTILAAIDETEHSKQVVPIAHELAVKYDDSLVVLHVIPMKEYESHKASIESLPDFNDFSLSQEADSAANFARRVVEETLGVPEVDVDPRGRVGNLADETLEEATEVEPRYLVLSGQRRSPTGKALFGSSSQKILLNARCPVVTKMSD